MNAPGRSPQKYVKSNGGKPPPHTRYPQPDREFCNLRDEILRLETDVEAMELESVRQSGSLDAHAHDLDVVTGQISSAIRKLAQADPTQRKALDKKIADLRSAQTRTELALIGVQDVIDSLQTQIESTERELRAQRAKRAPAIRRYAAQILDHEETELTRQIASGLERLLALRSVASQALKLNIWTRENMSLAAVDAHMRELNIHLQETANGT